METEIVRCLYNVFRVKLYMLVTFILDLVGLVPPNLYKGFFYAKIRF